MAAQLAGYGAKVVIADIDSAAATKLERELIAAGGTASTYTVDMIDEQQVIGLVADTVKQYERIDYWINGVGIVMGGELRDTALSDWHKVIHTNLRSTVNGTHIAYQQMLQQGSGHLVNIASAAGLLPTPVMAVYTTSKFAIVGLTHSLYAEARHLNINVSVVAPGFVDTPIYQTAIYNQMDKPKTLDLLLNKFPIQTPEQAAARIITGIARRKLTIHTWWLLRLVWTFYRVSPKAYLVISTYFVKLFRHHLRR